ncbi:MAG: hypothetical protein EOP84_23985, partial [Verrucomicrobiaceae bacterium]
MMISEKTFVQYFMPYREVGVVKNASKEAVAGIEFRGNEVDIKLHVTSPYEKIKVALVKGDEDLFAEVIKSSPEEPY